jgi:uncharacterized protein DUF4339
MSLNIFHIWRNGQSDGPFTVRALQDMLKAGEITHATLVASSGDDDWLPVSTFADVIDAPKQEVQPPPPKEPHEGKGLVLDTLTLARCLGRSFLLALTAGIMCVALGVVVSPLFLPLGTQLIGFAILLGVLSYGFKTGAQK